MLVVVVVVVVVVVAALPTAQAALLGEWFCFAVRLCVSSLRRSRGQTLVPHEGESAS